MPQAEITDTTTASEEDPHIGDVEPLLAGLRAEIEILHHLVQSSDEVDADTWLHVETRLEESRKKIHQTWHAAFQRHNADRREAEAALKAVRAEKAAPGSRKDAETVDALRRMLRSVAVVIMKDTSDFIAHDVMGAPEPQPRQDAELISVAADYADANAQIRRLEGEPEETPDEIFKPLDLRRYAARERAAELIAATPAGLRAKASIYLGEVDLMYRREGPAMEDRDSVELLADSIARDVTDGTTSDAGEDAELIRLCDRLVEIREAEMKIGDELGDDDAACDAAQKPYRDEWKTIEARLSDLGRPRTLAGAVAMARAAPLNVNVNDDGSPMTAELGMHMLLAVCAYLTNDGRPYFQPTAEGREGDAS